MSKLLKAFLVVAVLWLVVVGLAGAAGFALFSSHMFNFLPNLISVTESVQRTENLTHSGGDILLVDVRTRNGTVEINGIDGEEITIVAQYIARSASTAAAEAQLSAMKTILSENSGVLRIEGDFGSNTVSNQSIRYTVSVPRDRSIAVRTSNGTVKVYGVEGKLRLESSNGTIEVESKVGPEEVIAKTSNGKILLSVAPQTGLYDLRTSNGSVTVTVPTELGLKVRANTSNGSINLGSGQWSFSGGQISNRSVDAQRGNGEVDLIISTSNGSIKIEDK